MPQGLANPSGLSWPSLHGAQQHRDGGRQPSSQNPSIFQKTSYFNDFYTKGTKDDPYPLGDVQLIGKLRGENPPPSVCSFRNRPLSWSPPTAPTGGCSPRTSPIRTTKSPAAPQRRHSDRLETNNVHAHELLVRETRKAVRAMGYPFVFSEQPALRCPPTRLERCASWM
jgi:hypothetical protein